MFHADSPIGLLDSGIGGFTVMRELCGSLPCENIIYLADSANCPFGNRDAEEITSLTDKMLNFLQKKNVKLVLVACNTISSLWERYGDRFPFKILGIIDPMTKIIARQGIKEAGLVATVFTVKSNSYGKSIEKYSSDTKLYSADSEKLAALIDSGNIDGRETLEEVHQMMASLLKKKDVKNVILGCTHYPVVEDLFSRAAPNVAFLNPAIPQVALCERILRENNLLRGGGRGKIEVYTTGEVSVSSDMLNLLGMNDATVYNISSF